MRILVTGGAGFVGANLVARLLQEQHEVVVLDDLSTGSRDNLVGLDTELIVGSVVDARQVAVAVAGADSIVHLAAIPSVPRSVAAPMASHEANVTGTINVLEAARASRTHVTVASSSSVYGASQVLPKREDNVCRPLSPYAVSKLAAESYAMAWSATFGVPCLAFRFFNVYGPLQSAGHAYAAVIPAFVDAALSGFPLRIHGDGKQTRDFTYVGSVVDVLTQATTRRVTSDVPVNLAFGSRLSLLDVVTQLEQLCGSRFERTHEPPRPGDVRDSQADNSLLRSLFPNASPVDFSVGLANTVEWMRSQRKPVTDLAGRDSDGHQANQLGAAR